MCNYTCTFNKSWVCFDGIHWKYSVCLAVNQDKLELLN